MPPGRSDLHRNDVDAGTIISVEPARVVLRRYCPKCEIWLPDDAYTCPVCYGKTVKRWTLYEKLLALVLIAAAGMAVAAVLFPSQFLGFLQGIRVEFIEVTNGSRPLLQKLGLDNNTQTIAALRENISRTFLENMDSPLVKKIVAAKTKKASYLEKIDKLANFVASNIRYKKKRQYTNVTQILYRFSGDDRAHAILLAALFNQSRIPFKIDLVEDGAKGRGYHYRLLVPINASEEEVLKVVMRRIKKRRLGLTGIRAGIYFVQEGGTRWYVIDTTSQSMKAKGVMQDTSWTYIGGSHRYYDDRSHYSFELERG